MKEEQDMEAIKIHERELRDIIREYIHNDFIRGLMPEKILLVKKEDFQRMIQ